MSLDGAQTQAYDLVMSPDKKAVHVKGFAGTGKTTVMAACANEYGERAVVLAPTNKAADNLRKRGIYSARTIHSFLYTPNSCEIVKRDRNGDVIFHKDDEGNDLTDDDGLKIPVLVGTSQSFSLREAGECEPDTALVDEGSMLDDKVYTDLLNRFKRVRVFGDPFQLPPVAGRDIFNDVHTDIFLDKIHRVAAENPIIRYATAIREGREPNRADIECDEIRFTQYKTPIIKEYAIERNAQIICGRNKTRHKINDAVRAYKNLPLNTLQEGEPVVSLKNYRQNIDGERQLVFYNGQIMQAGKDYKKTDDNLCAVLTKLMNNDGTVDGAHWLWPFWNENYFEVYDNRPAWDNEIQRRKSSKSEKIVAWGAEFDYAYCLTVHKSQGSEFKDVVIFDEREMWKENYDTAQRWFYTAVTRAKEKILVARQNG